MTRGDVTSAVHVVIDGSLSPASEDPDAIESYWSAVVETRAHRGDVLVAERDGEVVGVCQVMIFQHFQHTRGWCCELESVYVREDCRSQGIGTALFSSAEMLARNNSCYRMQLTSRNVRLEAHRFCAAQGFEQTSQDFKKSLSAEYFS